MVVVCWHVVECCLSAVVGYSASYWCRGEYIVECSLCWVHGSLCMCKVVEGGFAHLVLGELKREFVEPCGVFLVYQLVLYHVRGGPNCIGSWLHYVMNVVYVFVK